MTARAGRRKSARERLQSAERIYVLVSLDGFLLDFADSPEGLDEPEGNNGHPKPNRVMVYRLDSEFREARK